MASPKKTATKPTPKTPKPKPAAAYAPLPEATPRYAPPPPEEAPVAPVAQPQKVADPLLRLAAHFWWAFTWRATVVAIPLNFIIQFLTLALYGEIKEDEQTLGFIMLAITLVVNVLAQVAVLRHMLRKKEFKGFTFTLTPR